MEVTGENKRGSKGGRCKINNSCAPTYHLENMVGKKYTISDSNEN